MPAWIWLEGRLVYRMSPTGIIAKGWTNTSSKLQALDHAKDTFLFRLREFNLSELVVPHFLG